MENIRPAINSQEQELIAKSREKEAKALKSLQDNAYRVTLTGATHESFSDRSCYAVSISAVDRRLTEIQLEFVLAFFDKYLRGRSGDLLNGNHTNYPEVSVEKFSP